MFNVTAQSICEEASDFIFEEIAKNVWGRLDIALTEWTRWRQMLLASVEGGGLLQQLPVEENKLKIQFYIEKHLRQLF